MAKYQSVKTRSTSDVMRQATGSGSASSGKSSSRIGREMAVADAELKKRGHGFRAYRPSSPLSGTDKYGGKYGEYKKPSTIAKKRAADVRSSRAAALKQSRHPAGSSRGGQFKGK